MICRTVFFLLASFLPLVRVEVLASQEKAKALMQSQLDAFDGLFKTQYAPLEWKESYLQWSLDEEITVAKQQVTAIENITVKDFQRIVKKLFNALNDYHVSILFYSTEDAMLPLSFKQIDGRFYVAAIDRKYLSLDLYPIQAGDEVIAIDCKPMDIVFHEFALSEGRGRQTATDLAIAERFFHRRFGKKGDRIPHGKIKITIRHQNTLKEQTYTLFWINNAELYTNNIPARQMAKGLRASSKDPIDRMKSNPLTQAEMLSPLAQYCTPSGFNDPFHEMGERKSFVPSLGRIIWQSQEESHFYSYIFKTEDGHPVGYVRIPTYVHKDNAEYDEAAIEFAELMHFLNTRTDALVIDQVNNPGGRVLYKYALLSALTDRPLLVPKQKMSLSQKDIYSAMQLAESAKKQMHENLMNKEEKSIALLSGYPADTQFCLGAIEYYNKVYADWLEQRSLSRPIELMGIESIMPSPYGHYDLPILVLINELDFSCADFFPAVLQDNRRALLFGTKTAGAGGYVLEASFPNPFGIQSFRYTGSIAERMDGNPIENLGVTPDIPYALTPEDIRNGCEGYRNGVLKAVMELVN